MILQHVVVCKTIEFILHRIWLELKKAFDLAMTVLVLWMLAPLLKSVDKLMAGFGVLLLFIVAGLVSSADLNSSLFPLSFDNTVKSK
jgi:hypothetical protein